MKKLLLPIITLVLAVSCQEAELTPIIDVGDDCLYGTMESMHGTKTSMDENNNTLWSEGDQLVAFMKTTLGRKYQIKEEYVGSTTGSFSRVTEESSGDDLESGNELSHNVVLYPYTSTSCMKNDGNETSNSYKVNLNLPEIQTYAVGSFGNGSFPMIAVSSSNELLFKNICGGIKLQFKGEDKIKSIKLESIGGEKISGKATVIGYADETVPTTIMAEEAVSSVTLDCGDGVQLSDEPTTFIISVPPVVFESGMKITVTDTDGISRELTNTSKNTVKRSTLLTFPFITYTQTGVFELAEGTLTSYEVKAEGGTIEIPVVTNQDYQINIPDDAASWINVVKTKVLREEVITIVVSENEIPETRSAEILFTSNDDILQTVIIKQDAAEIKVNQIDYIDEYGINHGKGTVIDGVVWAPVNCGYHETDFQYGKLYQWGRKYGQGYSGDLYSANTLIGTYSDASTPTIFYGQVDLKTGQSPDNANVYYYSRNADVVVNQSNWLDTYSPILWNPGTEETPGKGTFDPCPDGWRVPTYSEMERLIKNHSPWTTENGQTGYWFSGSNPYEDQTSSIFLPSAGFINEMFYWRGKSGCYWTSMSDYVRDYYAYRLSFNNSQVQINGASFQAGYSVRCIQDNTASLPPLNQDYIDLSLEGTANTYIISESGAYKFLPNKGNSSETIDNISFVELLWESFGTDISPRWGELVSKVLFSEGYIKINTADIFKKGNAVIAAKDYNGNIVWSWHLWFTDIPQEQKYYNNAGTMMDRNLGATSTKPGDEESRGLLYQWGRKDPFLNSATPLDNDPAASTTNWPDNTASNANKGTIEYSIANPTRMITHDYSEYDWLYSSIGEIENDRWTTSDKAKSIYDPCPVGWRVPDGGSDGVWAKALGTSSLSSFEYDSVNRGINFGGILGDNSNIWYPMAGYRHHYDSFHYILSPGSSSYFWTASTDGNKAFIFYFLNSKAQADQSWQRGNGASIRCTKE